jgi:hypothetical protein
VLVLLAAHVKAFAEKHMSARGGSIVDRLQETFQRRFDTSPRSVRPYSHDLRRGVS